jgi:hypothetical protein
MEWCVLNAIGIGGEHVHGIRVGAFVDAGYVDMRSFRTTMIMLLVVAGTT